MLCKNIMVSFCSGKANPLISTEFRQCIGSMDWSISYAEQMNKATMNEMYDIREL